MERDLTTVTFREIEFGSADFRKECSLRNEVLRVPLGLNLYAENLDREKQQMHFGLFDESKELVACAIAVPVSATDVKIRQMAVHREHQGKGYGGKMMHSLEEHLAQRGCLHLFLHARKTAVRFYEKLGYVKKGDEFMEVGISHIRMEKNI